MKFTPNILIIIGLAILMAGQSYFLFDFYTRNKALEKSVKIVDKKMEAQKAENEVAILKLQDSIQVYDEYLAELNGSLQKIVNTIDAINKNSDEKKAAINSVTDADILTDILTKRYR